MGQQQLLLVILVTIIVGIATVVAINTFSSAAESANLDAVRQDVAQIASSAQTYFMKPAMLGGGGNSFTGLNFNLMAFPGTVQTDNTIGVNENGTYVISVISPGDSLQVVATPSSIDNYTAGTSGSGTSQTLTAVIGKDAMSWTNNTLTSN